ncbi:hypothetical protein AVEN_80872-1 [Araneus ventricosus]|uniref:Uncharacterized protein n=1 Tax=Araneus ventricosus TaxID=182803 RepID=A0A4Y2DPI6_ARAVE|nr:hypothetical protein AVEN_80872-1 [Araneus ventricosus]
MKAEMQRWRRGSEALTETKTAKPLLDSRPGKYFLVPGWGPTWKAGGAVALRYRSVRSLSSSIGIPPAAHKQARRPPEELRKTTTNWFSTT